TWFLSTLPAYAPLAPSVLETATALALAVVAGAAGGGGAGRVRPPLVGAAAPRARLGPPGPGGRGPPPGRGADARNPPRHRADARELALRALARRHRDHLFEDLTADRRDRRALEDDAAVDVHVVDHVAIHQRVGRELDRGHGLAAEHRAAARGEADDVAAA